jgi:hypothetical protein
LAAINLWSRLPPPNSVGTDELKDGAVTTNKIADGAVTSPKAGDSLKSEHILGDDTEVTTTSTTYAEVKNFNFYKDTTVESINWKTMEVVAEGMVSASGLTATVGVFVDTETTARLELTFTGTEYSVSRGTLSMTDLTTGLHKISVQMKISAAGTAYNRHIEIKAIKT